MARPKTFREATLALIDEGELLAEAEEQFASLQRRMAGYARLWRDAARGAKATLTLKLTVKVEDPTEGMFSVRGETVARVPSRPAHVTSAISAAGEGGEEVLMCRASGTANDNPCQRRLFTQDGRAIDQESGEPKEKAAPA
jgi:hypothetical protein